tara:strand:+ start:1402 stop:1827 length:426 start_codon:yes stop_codon:yes gene_type:complete
MALTEAIRYIHFNNFNNEQWRKVMSENIEKEIEFTEKELQSIWDSAETELYDEPKSSLVEMSLEGYVKDITSDWYYAFEAGWVYCRKCGIDRGDCGCERPHIADADETEEYKSNLEKWQELFMYFYDLFEIIIKFYRGEKI